QHKTIPILAGVGGGDSNFSVTKNSATPTGNARPFYIFQFYILHFTFLCSAVPIHSQCPIGAKYG
ncbi:hypothetical protein, partial [Phaeodactylibacter sp.]|uniref:hypothetical protein n=1 Tax=Phaeodactylibacter sp. TaxID=1940289 RepID=UPI0025CE67BA